jgi:hypothetical protein
MWWGVCGVGHYSVVDSAEDIFEESPEPLRHQQQPTPTRKLDQPLDQSVMVKVPKYRRLFVYPRIFISSVFILEFSGLFVGPNFITTKKTAQPKLNKVRCLLLNLISCSKVRVSKASTKKESKKKKNRNKKEATKIWASPDRSAQYAIPNSCFWEKMFSKASRTSNSSMTAPNLKGDER